MFLDDNSSLIVPTPQVSEFVPEILSLPFRHGAFLANVQCAYITFPGMAIF